MTQPLHPPAFDQAHFARALRTAMARKGFTQHDLALALEARTGKRPGQNTISYWLRLDDKAQLPSIRLLPALLDALDLSCLDLFPLPPAPEPGEPSPPGLGISGCTSRRLRRGRRPS